MPWRTMCQLEWLVVKPGLRQHPLTPLADGESSLSSEGRGKKPQIVRDTTSFMISLVPP
jgi:hypothetical protein